MENPEEILHCLEEFSKLKPKDIPRELDEYLSFVAKTGDPVYQWSVIKSLFREKLISVITEFYESCPSVDIPPCPNVDLFNYDTMKNFILEKLDTFVAAPFTVQRICELLTSPRKEYNRIDKYMRALEKNILVVSTTEPGSHRTPENGDGFVNGIESDHMQDGANDINIEEMDDSPAWPQKTTPESISVQGTSKSEMIVDTFVSDSNAEQESVTSGTETVITCCPSEEQPYVSIERVSTDSIKETPVQESDVSVTITAIPAAVQKRRDSIEPPNEQAKCEPVVEEKVIEDTTDTENNRGDTKCTETLELVKGSSSPPNIEKTIEPTEAPIEPTGPETVLPKEEESLTDKKEIEPNIQETLEDTKITPPQPDACEVVNEDKTEPTPQITDEIIPVKVGDTATEAIETIVEDLVPKEITALEEVEKIEELSEVKNIEVVPIVETSDKVIEAVEPPASESELKVEAIESVPAISLEVTPTPQTPTDENTETPMEVDVPDTNTDTTAETAPNILNEN